MLRFFLLSVLHIRSVISLLTSVLFLMIVKVIFLWLSLWIEIVKVSSLLWFFVILFGLLSFEKQIFLAFIIIFAVITVQVSHLIILLLYRLLERIRGSLRKGFLRSRRAQRSRRWTYWSRSLRYGCINTNSLLSSWIIFFIVLKLIVILTNNNKLFINLSFIAISQMYDRILILTHQINNRNHMMIIFPFSRINWWWIFEIFSLQFHLFSLKLLLGLTFKIVLVVVKPFVWI